MVDNNGDPDIKRQVRNVKDRFSWFREYGKESFILMFHTPENTLFKWLEVKKSDIRGAGMGIFTLHDIPKGSIVTVYLGHFIDKMLRVFTQFQMVV